MSETTERGYPLTHEMRAVLAEYVEATEARDGWEERRVKARDALIAFLAVHEADTGTVDGEPVCAYSKVDRETIDVAALRKQEPAIARRFAKLSTVERFTLRGRHRVA